MQTRNTTTGMLASAIIAIALRTAIASAAAVVTAARD
jgi:hypothetical protein